MIDDLEQTPALLRDHPSAVAPPGFWSFLGVVAWIGSRDLRLVAAVEVAQAPVIVPADLAAREIWEEDLPSDLAHYRSQPFGDLSTDRFSWAVREAMARLQGGRIPAFGIRDGENEHVPLPCYLFAAASPSYHPADGFRLLPHVGNLRLPRSDVVEQWPAAAPGNVVPFAGAIPPRKVVSEAELSAWAGRWVDSGKGVGAVTAGALRLEWPGAAYPTRQGARDAVNAEKQRRGMELRQGRPPKA